MNISEQPLDPNFLRIHPRGYTDEPEKIGGRGVMREKIAELIRELEKERKRSARWKAKAKEQYDYIYDVIKMFYGPWDDDDC